MEERRVIVRTRVQREAEIVLGGRGAETIQCTLRDLTSAGACIALPSTDQVPDMFELTLDRGHSLRRCRVRWRKDDRLGVLFEKPAD